MKKNINKNTIKRPRLVLNNATKFYLAITEFDPESTSDLFFFISLFYPVKNGSIKLIPQTEITTFDDAESAAIYYDTLVRYCEFNARNQERTDAFPFMKQHIQDFYKLAQEHNKNQER